MKLRSVHGEKKSEILWSTLRYLAKFYKEKNDLTVHHYNFPVYSMLRTTRDH